MGTPPRAFELEKLLSRHALYGICIDGWFKLARSHVGIVSIGSVDHADSTQTSHINADEIADSLRDKRSIAHAATDIHAHAFANADIHLHAIQYAVAYEYAIAYGNAAHDHPMNRCKFLRVERSACMFVIIAAAWIISSCAMGESSPTPVIAFDGNDQSGVESESLTPTPEPFRFDLPTPANEPVSAWRPPLYPVPLAISPYDHFYFARPIAADQINWPIADYRYGGIFFAPTIVHTGVDIPAPEGTPIMAAGPGTVVWAGWGLYTETPNNMNDPYGLAVAIKHDFGYKNQRLYTVYAHMSEMLAVRGQHVETGDIIGLVGATGATTGPHVHFEVRFPDNTFENTYNPELWIAPPQGWGVLAGYLTDKDGKPLPQREIIVRSEKTRKTRVAVSYGLSAANGDPYYGENITLADLPAGVYKLTTTSGKVKYQAWVEIFAGQVSFFTFQEEAGFNVTPRPTPMPSFFRTATPVSAP